MDAKTGHLQKRIQAFEHKCLRKLLRISYTEHKTNQFVRQLVTILAGMQEPFLATVKRWKLAWYGHISRHDSLSKTILQGTVESKQRRGCPRKSWSDNVKDWTNQPTAQMLHAAEDHQQWRAMAEEASILPPQQAPSALTG